MNWKWSSDLSLGVVTYGIPDTRDRDQSEIYGEIKISIMNNLMQLESCLKFMDRWV